MWIKRIDVAGIVLTSLLAIIVLLPMIQHAREAARKNQCRINFKQIGIVGRRRHLNEVSMEANF